MSFDPFRVLNTLQEHGVAFVVIGGIAATAHGSPSVTMDLDVCYRRDRRNLERLAAALQQLDARLRAAPDDVPFILDAETLERGDHFTFATEAGDLDCIGTPAGTDGYDDLAAGASVVDLAGLEILVASIDDLIRMKRAAGRPKDQVEAEILGALRDELDGM